MNSVFWLYLLPLALPALLASAYLLLLTLLSRRLPTPPYSAAAPLYFDVVVPAHDEASGIAGTIASLLAVDWPRERFRVLVVADNCSDDTAAIAAAAGARVLERHDPSRRGKGHALAFGFAASRADALADAVVIIDADSVVSANLLHAFAARLQRGAQAVQAHYGVRNPQASWRTRLMSIATAAFHGIRSRARQRLRLSCGVRGNGWCVSSSLPLRVPYRAFSLAEDLEYGIALGLAGIRVHYAEEAEVKANMEANGRSAGSQRQRWERGRFDLLRSHTLPLLRASLQQRSSLCLDLALDLLVPPLSYLALAIAAWIGLGLTLGVFRPLAWHWWCWPTGCAAALILYVLRGWQLSGVGRRGLLDLAIAPLFVVWKLLTLLRHRRSSDWIRTERRPS